MINPFYDLERKLDKLLQLRLPIPPFIINLLLAEWCKAHQKLTNLEWQRLHTSDAGKQAAALDTRIDQAQQSCRQIGSLLRQTGPRKVETLTRRFASARPTAATYYHLANLFEKHLGHKPIIREFLRQTITLDPEHIQAHWLLAKLIYRQWRGNWTRALPHYQKVLSVFPQDPEGNWAVAKMLVEEKDYEAAREYYEKAVALNPEDVSVHEEYADLLWKHFQDTETAALHYMRAFTLSKGHKRLRKRLRVLREESSLNSSLRQQIDTVITAFTPSPPSRPSKAEQIIQRYAQWVAQNQKLLDLVRQRLQLIGTETQWDVQAQIDQQLLQIGKTGRGLKGLVGVLPNKLKEHVLPELEADPTADDLYHLATFLHRYYAFDGSKIGDLCRRALELDSEHIFAHWLMGRISERGVDRNVNARKHYEAAIAANLDYFEAYLLLAGLPYAFEGEEAIQQGYLEQAVARLQFRRRGRLMLESAQDDLGAACNAFFLPEQRVQITGVQMTYAGIIGDIAAQTILLDAKREPIPGDLVDSLVKQLLDQPSIQNVLVSYPRVFWSVDVIKKLLELMIQIIEFTLQARHPEETVTEEMVDKIGYQITAALRGRARLFRSNMGHRGWFEEWWRQSRIDRYYQYYETGSWKGVMGGRFVTSSKDPDDWEEPW